MKAKHALYVGKLGDFYHSEDSKFGHGILGMELRHVHVIRDGGIKTQLYDTGM